MVDMMNANLISEETFAAWLDGTLSPQEEDRFMQACAHDERMQEILEAYDQVDETYEEMVEQGFELPEELTGDFDIPQISPVFDDSASHNDLGHEAPYDHEAQHDTADDNEEEEENTADDVYSDTIDYGTDDYTDEDFTLV